MNKRKIKKETPITHEESIRRGTIVKRVKLMIKTVATILLFFFGWLSLKDFPYIELLNDDFSAILLKISLGLYYFSWIFGTYADLEDEEYTLLIAPNKGKITNMAVGTIAMLGLLFAILCWAKDFRVFSISLFLFFLFDRLGNIYLVRYIRPAIDESKKKYIENENISGLLSINSIDKFLSGKYINWRFGIGILIVLIMVLFSFTELPVEISVFFGIKSPDLLIVFLIFLYVVVIELWIWYQRLRRKIYLQLLIEIDEKYQLNLKEDTDESE